MRAILQRVSSARVVVTGEVVGEIGRGWLVLLGVAHADSPAEAAKLADKVANLRAFADGLCALGVPVAEGRFGADMQVELVNNGPVTLILDTAEEAG